MDMTDKSNGYEAIAKHFIRARNHRIGPSVVRNWAKVLPRGASVLDIGCGYGEPISVVLMREGFEVYGVDASATLIAEYRRRFPNVPLECNSVEDSPFFGRTFDTVVAWGLMFLLAEDAQRVVIGKVARALNPNGQFLFTATREPHRWIDCMTDLPSISLGHDAYVEEMAAQGLRLVGNAEDEGENYYYIAAKTADPRAQ